MNAIAISTNNNSIAEPVKSAWAFTSTMDDSVHSEAQQVLSKWSSREDEDDDDLMMMDTEGMPGVVSESDYSESSSSSFSSSCGSHHHDDDDNDNDVDVDVDDILMMKLDEEDGLLMDDLLDVHDADDDLQMLEGVLASSPPPSSTGGRSGFSGNSSSGRRWSTASASPDAYFSSSFLQGTAPASASSSASSSHQYQQPSVLDERLQQTVLKLQESMKRSSETRRSLYAQSATLSNYRRTHSVRQVLSNVEYTSRGVARSFSDPTPLSQMQHSLR